MKNKKREVDVSRRSFFKLTGTALGTALIGGRLIVPRTARADVVETSCGAGNTGGKVLVAYDSKHGSTSTIANTIGAQLCANNFEVDIRLARNVTTLSGYDAVVLGSPIYLAKFLPNTMRFFEDNYVALQTLPTAVFYLCTFVDQVTGIPNPLAEQVFVDPILNEQYPLVNYVSVEGFGGRWAYNELFPYEYIAMKKEGFNGGDYIALNIPRATTWADTISPLL